MTATGAGGDAVAAVTVYVTNPPPPPPPPAAPKASLEQRLGEVQDILFDYDKSEVREDARAVLQRNADVLKAILSDFPSAVVTIEAIATSVARPNITSAWATAVPLPPRSSSRRSASPPTA